MRKNEKRSHGKEKEGEFVEGRDYYFENGLLVMTAEYLKRRGYCCSNGCKNCPYRAESPPGTLK